MTMDRAGAADIPSAARFSEVLRQRRKQTRGPARLLQQLIGIEAKLRQYEEGERFIAAVEDSGGPELRTGPGAVRNGFPPFSEIRNPSEWISRVGPTPALSGCSAGVGVLRLTLTSAGWSGVLHLSRSGTSFGVRGVGWSRTRWPSWFWPPLPACRVTAIHVDHGLRPGSAAESEGVVAAAADRFGGRSFVPYGVEGRGRVPTSKPGPGGTPPGPGARGGHRPYRRRPGRNRAGNLLRGAGVNGLAAMRAGPRHPLLGPPPVGNGRSCASRRGSNPRPRPQQRGSAVRPVPGPPRAPSPCARPSPDARGPRSRPSG